MALKITVDSDCSHEIKRCLLLGRKVMANLDSILNNRNITLPTKVHIIKAMVFPVIMYGCEGWTTKKCCFWTMVLEKTLESPLDCKEIQPVHPKENQSWIFIGRTDVEPEAQKFWLPDSKDRLIGKDSDAGKDWRQEKGMTVDEMIGWHLWLDGHEFEQPLGVGDGQGSLVCYSPWGCKELGTTEWLNWTDGSHYLGRFIILVQRLWRYSFSNPFQWCKFGPSVIYTYVIRNPSSSSLHKNYYNFISFLTLWL